MQLPVSEGCYCGVLHAIFRQKQPESTCGGVRPLVTLRWLWQKRRVQTYPATPAQPPQWSSLGDTNYPPWSLAKWGSGSCTHQFPPVSPGACSRCILSLEYYSLVVLAPVVYSHLLTTLSWCLLPLYTRGLHWQFVVLSLDRDSIPVVEVRDNCLKPVSPRSQSAAFYFANVCTLILQKRHPKMPTCIVYRKRCGNDHSINACGLCVIAQTMLFAENKQNTHRVTRCVTDKLRKWIITYLMEYDTMEIDIPVTDTPWLNASKS